MNVTATTEIYTYRHTLALHDALPIWTLNKQKQEIELTATSIGKRLRDYGFHAPTVYFPLLVPECLLIEPTESEDRETLDASIDALVAIWEEAKQDIAKVKGAPYTKIGRAHV